MIEKGLFLTGDDAELLSNALAEAKTKALQESEVRLDDAQALGELVANFRNEKEEQETCCSLHDHFSKRLFLGTIIAKHDSRILQTALKRVEGRLPLLYCRALLSL